MKINRQIHIMTPFTSLLRHATVIKNVIGLVEIIKKYIVFCFRYQGFRVLIEREWLDFGHKFADRCGHQFGPEDPNERSPIFLQWLDVVHQMMLQYPCSFEFNDAYLVSCLYLLNNKIR